MILINLLPPEFRRQPERLSLFRVDVDPKIVKIGGTLFLVLTAGFYLQYFFGLNTLKGLEKRWSSIQQELRGVNQIKAEMEQGSKGERNFLENYVLSPYPSTQILSAVSELLPASIWLVDLEISRQPKENRLVLKGLSRPSAQQSSVQEIEKYLRDLKTKFPMGAELVLTTSRQQRDRSELTLFTAVFRWP